MNTKAVLARPLGITIAAAALSFLVAIGLFTAVAGLFLRNGAPLQDVAIAERACIESVYVSERDACVRSFLAEADRRRVASR